MAADFATHRIEDIAFEMGDAPFGSNLKNSDYTDSGALVVQGKNIQGRSFDWSDKRHISKDKWDSLARSHCHIGDILFPKVGTIGKVGILSPCKGYEHYVLSTNTMRLRVDPNVADSLYVYYFFTWSRTVNLIHALNSKSVQPVFNFTTLKNFEIKLPPLKEQKAIAHILGSLDDKIELNRQMNETLEAMAQALFKSWFVDFDPVIDNALAAGNEIPEPLQARAAARQTLGDQRKPLPPEIQAQFPSSFVFTDEMGWIPEGWNSLPLDEIAHYQNGLALQKFRPEDENNFLPVVKIAQLKKGFADSEEKASPNIKRECIIDDGDVVFSWSGSLMVDIWCGGKAALNQHLFKVTSESYPLWFFYQQTKRHLEEFQRIAADKAVTMGHIKREHLSQAFCAVPDQAFLKQVSSIFETLVSRGVLNRVGARELSSVRDTLLPKLLSGELRVADAEQMAADVL